MASYSIDYTARSVTVTVAGASAGETYRFLIRYNTGTSTAQIAQEDVTATGTTVVWSYSNLTPETGYAVNVGTVVEVITYSQGATTVTDSGTSTSFGFSGYSSYSFSSSTGTYTVSGSSVTVSSSNPGTAYLGGGSSLSYVTFASSGAYTVYSRGVTASTTTGAEWFGAQTFTTEKEGADGIVYINGIPYAPYIFHNGGWQKAAPHVYSGGWKATEEKSNE